MNSSTNIDISQTKASEIKSNADKTTIERILRESAVYLPTPKGELPISPVMESGRKKTNYVYQIAKAAVLLLAFLLVGGGTAFAANPDFRQAVILFFTSGVREEIPVEELSGNMSDNGELSGSKEQGTQGTQDRQSGDEAQDTWEEPDIPVVNADPDGQFTPVTVGDVTMIQNRKLDEHFTATYLSSPKRFNTEKTPSGNLLFYTQEESSEERTYYQMQDGTLTITEPEIYTAEGRIKLGKLQGAMSLGGNTEYANLELPEMTFTVGWQQYGEDILLLWEYFGRDFGIAATFGEVKNGTESDYEGGFYGRALEGDTEWIQIFFTIDGQRTEYSYPFLFNIRTGETADPLAVVDLSAYPCIWDLCISADKRTATARAGENQENLIDITINLETREITEEAPWIAPPVEDYFTTYTTGENTVFYTVGDETSLDGYLYHADTGVSTNLFRNAAWGYTWEYGFAEDYVRMIGGNYAVFYKEPENEVYLLNLTDGQFQLLEGIPANHSVNFFWNGEYSILSMDVVKEDGSNRLGFVNPATGEAWYFEREFPEGVRETVTEWYEEYGYLIHAEDESGRQYLYLYQYTP